MASKKSPRNTRPTATRRRKPKLPPKYRQHIQLDSLIRLNWDESINVSPPVRVRTNLEQISLQGHPYQVEALDPIAPYRSCIRLDPKRKYHAVPIDDLSPTQRYLLVRQQKTLSSPRTFIVVNEATAPEQMGLHILGGLSDKPLWNLDLRPSHLFGVAEAILTPIETTPPSPEPDAAQAEEQAAQLQTAVIDNQPLPARPETEPPATSMDIPVQSPAPSSVTPPVEAAVSLLERLPVDEDLLRCIDSLNGIKEHHSAAESEIAQTQDGLHNYLRRAFGLEVIPISRNQTAFDGALHEQVDVSRSAKIDGGIITSIRCDGYRRPDHADLFRKAHVVVNQHTTQVVKLLQLTHYRPNRLYAELITPQKTLTDETYREAGIQVGMLDLLYTCLAIYHLGDGAALKTLLNHLESNAPLTQPLHAELDKDHGWPLRMTSVYHSERLNVQVHGHVAALRAMHRILHAEVRQREDGPPPDPNWLHAELKRLRPNMPSGLEDQEFNDLTTKLLAHIRDLLNQIAFAPEFKA